MCARLPLSDAAFVEEKKITKYLLDPAHEDGQSKARFFLARGFTVGDWEAFRDALVVQGKTNTVTKVTPHEFGDRYQVDCNCPTPDKMNPCIRTVWELKQGTDSPRLITAHPIDH
jgi:hypothetical protein